jgi:uncharacterized membrane protein YqaE (UPF0057 family)
MIYIRMKRILFHLTPLFFASQLLVSCSYESEILSQFSKKIYLKKYKSKEVRQEREINKVENSFPYELAGVEMASIEPLAPNYVAEKQVISIEVNNDHEEQPAAKRKVETLQLEIDYSKDYTVLKRNNRELDFLSLSSKTRESKKLQKYRPSKRFGVSKVVIGVLCVFIPPLAVYLYEGAITTNFWVDIVGLLFFGLAGMILAFLICFRGASF